MLKDKVVIITGGAGLIGQQFVKTVVENGGVAVIADIQEANAKAVREKLSNELNTTNISFVKLDITSKESIFDCIQKMHDKFGHIDALVNNAYPRNANYGRHFFEVEYEDFCQNLNMNLGGYFLTSQKFAQYFKKQGYGNIVNISSVYGVIAPKFEVYDGTSMTMPVEYAAIKSALIHLTKYMAKYFKGANIRVNAISPGGVFDGQNDVFVAQYNKLCLNAGMLLTSSLNGTLTYLLSDMSASVNGQNIVVDDGFTL